nr:PREDICTED: gustatory receptor for sugar taste 64f-like [Linepithema humile]
MQAGHMQNGVPFFLATNLVFVCILQTDENEYTVALENDLQTMYTWKTYSYLEHSAAVVSAYISAIECAAYRNDTDVIGTYFQSHFPQIFSRISYSLWKGILIEVINILSTFSWNFVDLFLILISIAVADQFRQLNSRLYAIRGKAMPDWWWAEARKDYNHLATLTRIVDSHISSIVLLSFATDLYFICIQLLFSFKYF